MLCVINSETIHSFPNLDLQLCAQQSIMFPLMLAQPCNIVLSADPIASAAQSPGWKSKFNIAIIIQQAIILLPTNSTMIHN